MKSHARCQFNVAEPQHYNIGNVVDFSEIQHGNGYQRRTSEKSTKMISVFPHSLSFRDLHIQFHTLNPDRLRPPNLQPWCPEAQQILPTRKAARRSSM
ncbi:hypothetical protein OAV21_02655 [bacterium]|nr:hypothetical protein [Verrucomicrobiales bacterium]MDC0503396.1 hypothetical protein [Verrucomicrobiales bacterium]MDC3255276.1 hypothetical protein [bacterium]MDF1785464.1 hypothetical protein [Verrucomicrobiales bacterium]